MDLKEAFWRLFWGLATSDGRLAEGEKIALKHLFLDKYGIDVEGELKNAPGKIAKVKSEGGPERYITDAILRIRAEVPRKQWPEVVKMLAGFILADQDVDINEVVLLREIAEKLEVNLEEAIQEALKEIEEESKHV